MPGIKSTSSHPRSTTTSSRSNVMKNKLWEKDGVSRSCVGDHGIQVTRRSSIEILLAWLQTNNNYARWCGQTQVHQSKEQLAKEIHQGLINEGILTRSPKNIRSKIEYLEGQFRKALTWEEKIGRSMFEKLLIKYQGNQEKAHEWMHGKLLKICPYWDALLPIFGKNYPVPVLHTCHLTSPSPTMVSTSTPTSSQTFFSQVREEEPMDDEIEEHEDQVENPRANTSWTPPPTLTSSSSQPPLPPSVEEEEEEEEEEESTQEVSMHAQWLQIKRDLVQVKMNKLALLKEQFEFEKHHQQALLQLHRLKWEHEQWCWQQAHAIETMYHPPMDTLKWDHRQDRRYSFQHEVEIKNGVKEEEEDKKEDEEVIQEDVQTEEVIEQHEHEHKVKKDMENVVLEIAQNKEKSGSEEIQDQREGIPHFADKVDENVTEASKSESVMKIMMEGPTSMEFH